MSSMMSLEVVMMSSMTFSGTEHVINDVIGGRSDVINDMAEGGLQHFIGNVIDDVISCEHVRRSGAPKRHH